MAALQVLQWGVCDQGAVVQLDHLQTVVSTGAAAEVSDAIISNQLTVRQALQEHSSTNTWAPSLNCLLEQAVIWCLWMLQEQNMFKWQAHTHQDLQTRAVDRQLDECSICDLMQK